MRCVAALFLASLVVAPTQAAPPPAPDAVLERIAFGSCADQSLPMPIWDGVAAVEPDLFVFLGDNVYGDVSGPELTELKAAYAAARATPGYGSLLDTTPIMATWDDHDYGANDAGGDFPYRQDAQTMFLDFFEVPDNDPRRDRPGVYDSRIFGPAGQRVQLIVLDTRTFRSPLRESAALGAPGRERYDPDPNPDKTMLGPAQWAFLAESLRQPADFRIIASSIQVLADGHGFERWGNLPTERARLFQLIDETDAGGLVFISGDRHVAAIYEGRTPAGERILEVTSSSLNRPWRNAPGEAGPARLGPIFTQDNFGLITIDWDHRTAELSVRDRAGGIARRAQWRMPPL